MGQIVKSTKSGSGNIVTVEKCEEDAANLSIKLWAIFKSFFKLGLTSFGGPIAHLGYFRDEFVVRQKWIEEAQYADVVGLCQFLPGPTSSQVGFTLGFLRGGAIGGIAAWIAFTLPSAIAMFIFATSAFAFTSPAHLGFIHGLKLVAVIIVSQAFWGMARNLTPDQNRATIAVTAATIVILTHQVAGQIGAVLIGAFMGIFLCPHDKIPKVGRLYFPISRTVGMFALAIFFILLFILPNIGFSSPSFSLADQFYRVGALVFGGGHVVLPLLEKEVVTTGFLNGNEFLVGYGAAQAVPGPLFTFAAYLGALTKNGPGGAYGAIIALIAIFLPGFLLVVGIAPFWNEIQRWNFAQSAMSGVNASVVGILGATLYHPVWTGSVLHPLDFALVIIGFLLFTQWRLPSWVLVLAMGALSAFLEILPLPGTL